MGSYTGPLEILDADGTVVAKVLGRLTKRQWQRSGRTDWSGIVHGSGVDFLEVLRRGDELAVRVGGRVGTAFMTPNRPSRSPERPECRDRRAPF